MEDGYCISYYECPVVRAYENGKINREWIEMYCEKDWTECARFRLDDLLSVSTDFVLPDGSVEERLSK
ncbi:hypothetical protein Y696_01895 [Mesotoga sp. H07pep.5.4]|uniref:hypothetical protein n=1 Tax=unclassified Mesotoga TaxID=1184398 RepID=UPI000C1819D9|nr:MULTISPECIES: hypothetical protein [unclassified Mesotoga]MDK2944504.1 hypothetical protein [Mesotoga sp.]PIJ62452.1 hypothetical protein V513_07535 [Mesotoga sp. H07.pep.5.3]RLL86858.1 hypothetical protein Y696_01895 [Mesotoga sp. H07pep.5.4]